MKTALTEFYGGKKILVTGHTGFKGGWLVTWLKALGAEVTGYSLPPEEETLSMYHAAAVENQINSIMGDVRDLENLEQVCKKHQPQLIFHLAAQALVRRSFKDPVQTYATNVMGTVNLLEAALRFSPAQAVIVITSDKCYENREWSWGYREIDPLGGYDPYSSSKGCAELVTAAYRNSFYDEKKIALASTRAGNVIGGGDWAEDRIIPDIYRAIAGGKAVTIRNPGYIRPWQHVLDPLYGYLLLGKKMFFDKKKYAEAWNFGPQEEEVLTVFELAQRIHMRWGSGELKSAEPQAGPHESSYLKLDCSKSRSRLGWRSRLNIEDAVNMTVDWYNSYMKDPGEAPEMTIRQIQDYMAESI